MARIFVEGGGDRDLDARCREAFTELLRRCGFQGRMPRLVACGGRNNAYDRFCTAHQQTAGSDWVALLIDSEDPVANIEATWAHLKGRDRWEQPVGATDEQVLLMTTSMETWIIADHAALRARYSADLQAKELPALEGLESRPRQDVLRALSQATRNSRHPFRKGNESFQVLLLLDPAELARHLPSFARARRILDKNLRVTTDSRA